MIIDCGTDTKQIANRQIAPYGDRKNVRDSQCNKCVCDGSLAESRSHERLRVSPAGSSHMRTGSSALVFPTS